MKIGIVGGGLMGMALAFRLTRMNHKVSVFERDSQVGGLTTYMNYGPFYWDRFYHVILPSDQHLIRFLHDLGIADQLRWARTFTGFYVDGKFHSMSNALEFLRFPPVNLFGKLRLALTILYCARINNWQALEQISVGDWLRRFSGAATYEKIWKPLLLAKLGEHYQRVSAVFIWSYIKRMFSARDGSAGKEQLGYVAGGYKTVFDRLQKLVELASGSVRTGVCVERIESSNDGGLYVHSSPLPRAGEGAGERATADSSNAVQTNALPCRSALPGANGSPSASHSRAGARSYKPAESRGQFRQIGTTPALSPCRLRPPRFALPASERGEDKLQGGLAKREHFDKIIFTSPVSVLRQVAAPELIRFASSTNSEVEYLGVICMVLLTRKPLVPYYVVNIADARIPFTGIIGMSNLVSLEETDGLHITFLPKYVDSNSLLLRKSNEELQHMFMSGLRLMFPDIDDKEIQSIHINRASKVQPLQVLHYSRLVTQVVSEHPDFSILNTAQFTHATLNNNEVIGAVDAFIANGKLAPSRNSQNSSISNRIAEVFK